MVSELVEMTPDERAVWREIERHPGRANALALDHLCAVAGIEGRVVQTIIKHLIERHGCPIGSTTGSPHGYFVITTLEEQTHAEQQLEHRIIKTAQRLAALKKNTPSECLGQIQLALNEA